MIDALRQKEDGFVPGWEQDVQRYIKGNTFKGISVIQPIE